MSVKNQPLLSRRRLLAAGSVAGLALKGSRPVKASGNKNNRATAFALIGDRFHNSDYIRSALGKTLVRDAGISIDFTDEVTALNNEKLSVYRMLIVFRSAVIWPGGYGPGQWWPGYHMRPGNVDSVQCVKQDWYPGYKKLPPMEVVSVPPVPHYPSDPVHWMTAEQGLAVKRFVEAGGAALFYHNAAYISARNRHFRDVLGATTRYHPPIRPYKVKIVNRDHPITRGVNDFVVTDEQHFVEYDKNPASILAKSVNEDGLTHAEYGNTAESCWAFEHGKGRVCFMSPGHTIDALWNPEYEKLQKNAVRWLLRDL